MGDKHDDSSVFQFVENNVCCKYVVVRSMSKR